MATGSMSPAFMRVWAALAVSSIGDWAGILATTVLVARLAQEDAAAWAVAAMMGARLVALALLGPIATAFADRLDRRRALIGTDLARAALTAALPLSGDVLVVVCVVFALEGLGLLWAPLLDASLPNLVSEEALPRANALRLVASYGMLPVGSALFAATSAASARAPGFVGEHVEAVALWVDAATFVISASLVASVASGVLDPGRQRRRATTRGPWHALLRNELRYLRTDTTTRQVVMALALGFLAASSLSALGPLLTLFVLDADASVYGVLVGVFGAGMLGGAVFGARRPGVLSLRAMHLALAGTGAALASLSLVATWPAAAVLAAAAGLCAGIAMVVGYTTLQRNVPDENRARTFAALTITGRSVLLGGRVVLPAAVGALGGILGDQGGATRSGLAVSGVVVALAAVVGLRLSQRPAEEPGLPRRITRGESTSNRSEGYRS
jgi:dTMP kinase